MKKCLPILVAALSLASCVKITPATSYVPETSTTTTTAATTTTTAATTQKETKYIEGYYDVNYTLKKIHRSGCDKLLTGSDQEFEIMLKNITYDWIDKKHFSTCGYCDPEIPKLESVNVDLPPLYVDLFSPYALGVGETAPGAITQKLQDHPEYTFEHVKGSKSAVQSYTINDPSGDYIYMEFYPRYKGDAVEGLSLLCYHRGDKEISVSDDAHISKPKYTTFDATREPARDVVSDISDLEIFMFSTAK